MPQTLETGQIGYRDQLHRARRFLERVQRLEASRDNATEFEDTVWAFFQNCWHIKDWLRSDPLLDEATKEAATSAAYLSEALRVCQDLCNGTKHIYLREVRSGAGAQPNHEPIAGMSYSDPTYFPWARGKVLDPLAVPPEGGAVRAGIDFMVEDDQGNLVSGVQLALRCLADWERILTERGLAIERRS